VHCLFKVPDTFFIEKNVLEDAHCLQYTVIKKTSQKPHNAWSLTLIRTILEKGIYLGTSVVTYNLYNHQSSPEKMDVIGREGLD